MFYIIFLGNFISKNNEHFFNIRNFIKNILKILIYYEYLYHSFTILNHYIFIIKFLNNICISILNINRSFIIISFFFFYYVSYFYSIYFTNWIFFLIIIPLSTNSYVFIIRFLNFTGSLKKYFISLRLKDIIN